MTESNSNLKLEYMAQERGCNEWIVRRVGADDNLMEPFRFVEA